MDKTLYQNMDPTFNVTIEDAGELTRILTFHGIKVGRIQLEMDPRKNATTQQDRTLSAEQAVNLMFGTDVPYNITMEIGGGYDSAARLCSLIKLRGAQQVVKELFFVHNCYEINADGEVVEWPVEDKEAAWAKHLLNLPKVREAVAASFK